MKARTANEWQAKCRRRMAARRPSRAARSPARNCLTVADGYCVTAGPTRMGNATRPKKDAVGTRVAPVGLWIALLAMQGGSRKKFRPPKKNS